MIFLRIFMILLAVATTVSAATIQYQTASGVVTGANDVPLDQSPAIPGYAYVEVTGLAADIQWPLPAGCTVRDPDWVGLGVYHVDDPLLVTAEGAGMSVNATFGFFPTNSAFNIACRAAQSAPEVDAIFKEQYERLTNRRARLYRELSAVITQVNTQCPDSVGATACVEARAARNAILVAHEDRSQLRNYVQRIAELYTQGEALKTAKGWTD